MEWDALCGWSARRRVGLLTAGSFVLDVDLPLQDTAHGSHGTGAAVGVAVAAAHRVVQLRSEERRVGKECRSRGSPDH